MICHNNYIPFLNLRDFEKLFEIFTGLKNFTHQKSQKKNFEIFDWLRCLTDRSLSCKNKCPNCTMIM